MYRPKSTLNSSGKLAESRKHTESLNVGQQLKEKKRENRISRVQDRVFCCCGPSFFLFAHTHTHTHTHTRSVLYAEEEGGGGLLSVYLATQRDPNRKTFVTTFVLG